MMGILGNVAYKFAKSYSPQYRLDDHYRRSDMRKYQRRVMVLRSALSKIRSMTNEAGTYERADSAINNDVNAGFQT